MKRIAIALIAIASLGLAGLGISQADAANPWRGGIRVGPIGIGVGQVGGYYTQNWRGGLYPQRTYYGHPRSGNLQWHNTSHYDWHPTQIIPHGNHYHVQPGHWDFHYDGHWDSHHGHFGH